MIKINSNTGFQKLQSCLVGQCYPPEFFAFIKNSRLRSIFEKIATETEEDYTLPEGTVVKTAATATARSMGPLHPHRGSSTELYMPSEQAQAAVAV
jgi:hypothetical protein